MSFVLVVDGGMWTDPALVGPFASEAEAESWIAEQHPDDDYVVLSPTAPSAFA